MPCIYWRKASWIGEWNLMANGAIVATLWHYNEPRATWHTWDRDGCGGENGVEHGSTPAAALRRAKAEATLSAIEQGFV